jgi:hypothetical protein
MTIFCCLRFETPHTWRARSPYLYPPGTGCPSYTPRYLVPFSSPPMTRRVTVEVFTLRSMYGSKAISGRTSRLCSTTLLPAHQTTQNSGHMKTLQAEMQHAHRLVGRRDSHNGCSRSSDCGRSLCLGCAAPEWTYGARPTPGGPMKPRLACVSFLGRQGRVKGAHPLL